MVTEPIVDLGFGVSGDVKERRRSVNADNVHSPFGETVADAAVAAWRVQDSIPSLKAEQQHDLGGVAVVSLVGELTAVEVQVVVAERLLEVEPHLPMLVEMRK